MMRLMKMKHQKEIQVLYFGSKSMCIFKGAVLNSRFKVVPAVYLIHICMNKILLSLRKNTGFYDGYYSLVAGHIEGNETMTQAISFELLDPREGETVKQHFYELMQVSLEPFLSAKQPFDFSNMDYDKRSKDVIFKFIKSLKYSPPPRRVIFLHRKLGGLFSLLRKMQVKIDLNSYWETKMKNVS